MITQLFFRLKLLTFHQQVKTQRPLTTVSSHYIYIFTLLLLLQG